MTAMRNMNQEEGLRQVILRATASRRADRAQREFNAEFGTDFVDPDLQNPFAAGSEESARSSQARGLLGPASRHSFTGGPAHA